MEDEDYPQDLLDVIPSPTSPSKISPFKPSKRSSLTSAQLPKKRGSVGKSPTLSRVKASIQPDGSVKLDEIGSRPRSRSQDNIQMLIRPRSASGSIASESPTSDSGLAQVSDEHNEFLDLLDEDEDKIALSLKEMESNDANIENKDDTSPTEMEPTDDMDDEEEEDYVPAYQSPQKATETTYEDEQKLLVGKVEGEEVILAGTVDKLMSSLTSKRFGKIKIIYDAQNPQLKTPPYVVEFLFTYRYFWKSEQDSTIPPAQLLLSKLIAQYPFVTPANATPEQISEEGTTQLRIIGIVKHWVENHFYDFCEDSVLMNELLSFVNRIVSTAKKTNMAINNGVLLCANQLQKYLEQQLHEAAHSGTPAVVIGAIKHQLSTTGMVTAEFIKILYVLMRKNELGTIDSKKKRTATGATIIGWIIDTLSVTKEVAVGVAEKLLKQLYIQNVKEKTSMQMSDQATYQIMDRSIEKKDIGNTSTGEKEQAPPKPHMPKSMKSLNLVDWNPTEVARQLTLIESRLFSKITPPELSHQAWNRPGAKEHSPHLIRIIERFNDISYWVVTELVTCTSLKTRVTTLKRFLHIAEYCRKYNNFSTMMAIMIGLNMGCLQHLKKTWEALSKPYHTLMQNLNQLINAHQNFKVYRSHLSLAAPPAIPYMAVYLRDLTFIEDGNENFRQDGLVNFEKMSMLAKIFGEVAAFQKHSYNFIEIAGMQQLLLSLAVTKDDVKLYQWAKICEDPNSNVKTLKPPPIQRPEDVQTNGSTSSVPKDKKMLPILRKSSPEISHKKQPVEKEEKKFFSFSKKKSVGIKRSLKVVLVGDGMVGKTSILVAYTTNAFPELDYVPTIFDNYNSIETFDDQEVSLILWDTAGQEDLSRIRTLNYAGTDVFIVCYAASSRVSFLNIEEKWLPEIKNYCPDAIFAIAGLKSDLLEDPKTIKELEDLKQAPVKQEEGDMLCKHLGGLFHLQCSAKKGINVTDLFRNAMKAALQQKKKKKR